MSNGEVNITKRGKIFSAIGVIVLVIGFVSWFIVSKVVSKPEPSDIDILESSIEETTVATEMPYHRNEVFVSTGIDTARVALDKQVADSLFNSIFTWGDGVGYNQAREVLLNHMSQEEADRMMPENTVITSGMVSTIDQDMWYTDAMGLNSEFLDARYVVSGFDADIQTYEYIAIVTVNATSDIGNEGEAQYIITFETDVNNNISNMEYDAVR